MTDNGSIRIEGLVKRFRQKGPQPRGQDWVMELAATVSDTFLRRAPSRTVLDGINLDIRGGELFGLLGPNGAGKTTLIKLLTCLLYPDEGNAWIHGFNIRCQRRQVKSAFSLVTAQGWLGTLFYLTLRQNLEFYGRLNGIPEKLVHSRINEALEWLEIADKSAEHPWSLSAGQLQKLNLAKIYLRRTPIVFLDEPTAHLDPRASRAIRTFVRDVLNGQLGQTIFMSTHYLQEAESMCDRVAILDGGRMVAQDTITNLKRELQGEPIIELKLDGYTPAIGEALRAAPGVREVFEQLLDTAVGLATLRVALSDGGGPEIALKVLNGTEARTRSVRLVEPSLEEVFFHHVRRRFNEQG